MLVLTLLFLPTSLISSKLFSSSSKSSKLDYTQPHPYSTTHLDPTRSDRLGDDDEPLVRDPRDQHLSWTLAQSLGDLNDLFRVDDSRSTRDIVAQR